MGVMTHEYMHTFFLIDLYYMIMYQHDTFFLCSQLECISFSTRGSESLCVLPVVPPVVDLVLDGVDLVLDVGLLLLLGVDQRLTQRGAQAPDLRI